MIGKEHISELTWNHDLQSYEAIIDGERILVDGDTFAEERRDDVRRLLSEHYPGWDELEYDAQRDILDGELAKDDSPYVQQVEKELYNPLTWTADMDGVTIEPV